ncbi:MAG: hypothetical protein A3F16_04075 [Deltaproteobacteria bacterium RIFCSPHIGHO2_12_FULL_43_9]|nr:MAG: hypothetical protein A3F16_04075 [Deltaproteobacteria bacterium RIFCSPHIGHO2_12_FULL_43_9]
MLTKEDIMNAIHPIEDPELHVSIVELGLVYGIEVNDSGVVDINMTLTSPACPLGPQIKSAVEMTVGKLSGIQKVNINWVWSPPWDPRERCSDDAKVLLGIY